VYNSGIVHLGREVAMTMMEYILEVKRILRDEYGFVPLPGSTKAEPLLDVPDGVYPMRIEGKLDNVRITKGKIYCCNFA